jgi:YidC/Oxa1 family membrane protein insertase
MKLAVNDEKLHAQMKANAAKTTQTQAKKNKKGKSKWQMRYEEALRQQQQAQKRK